jgi:hypothetical protein
VLLISVFLGPGSFDLHFRDQRYRVDQLKGLDHTLGAGLVLEEVRALDVSEVRDKLR